MRLLLLICTLLLWSVIVAVAADPKPIAARVGQEFEIVLDSPGDSGRQWLLSKPLDAEHLKQSGREYRKIPRPAGPVRTCEVLRYTALKEGTTEIRLKYATVFESDKASVSKTNFVVIIRR